MRRKKKVMHNQKETQLIEADQQVTKLLELVKAFNNSYKYMKLFLQKGGYNEGISDKKMETFQRTDQNFSTKKNTSICYF